MLKEIFERFFIIHKCGGCGEILPYELRNEALCQSCALAVRIAKTESCSKCSQSVSECACMPRGLEKAGALCLRKLYFYRAEKGRAVPNRLLLYLKREPNKRVAHFVAGELWEVIERELTEIGVTAENMCLVSIPRGRKAHREYGFDQAALVCRHMSEISGVPYLPVIGRVRRAVEQKKLDRGKRFRNVESLFMLKETGPLRGKYVILYDDVVTTGASMAACVKLLSGTGVSGVFCISLAQVPENSVK